MAIAIVPKFEIEIADDPAAEAAGQLTPGRHNQGSDITGAANSLLGFDGSGAPVERLLDTDTALTADSDTRVATQKAVKAYIDSLIGANNVMANKGGIDCSGNPNYPAADNGHVYIVSVAGKIGGGSGPTVEVGDMILCRVDSSASGNHATVGANWSIIQTNIVGAYFAGGSDVSIADGGTGASTAAGARTNLGCEQIVTIKVFGDDKAVTTGDGKKIFVVPARLNGLVLVAVEATVTTVSSSGLPTVQIHNVTDAVDILSTRITIDASEYTSATAAAAPVINTSNDDVATGDRLRIDVDVAGTGAKGLAVTMVFN